MNPVSAARASLLATLIVAGAGCAKASPETAVQPVRVTDTVVVRETTTRVDTVVDPDTRQRLVQMEADLLTRDARIQVLEEQLEEARHEVVRTMARSQTVATRAEAASAIAEAELAIRTLRTAAGSHTAPEAVQAGTLLEQSSAAFDQGNFGGALYLAAQARQQAALGTDRIQRASAEDARPGETPFAAPLRLQTTTRSNVRDGPGVAFKVLYTLEAGSPVRGTSYVEGWVRIADDQGRSGWIARSLVTSAH
jgi:hypothetical protein